MLTFFGLLQLSFTDADADIFGSTFRCAMNTVPAGWFWRLNYKFMQKMQRIFAVCNFALSWFSL